MSKRRVFSSLDVHFTNDRGFCHIKTEECEITKANTDSCSASKSTVQSVENCPSSEQEWIEASRRKNCSAFASQCSEPDKFVYHCVISSSRNGTLEACAYKKIIVFGVCTEYSYSANRIQPSLGAACNNLTENPCPLGYPSNEAYKYPGCYELIKKPTTENPTTKTPFTSDTTVFTATVSGVYSDEKERIVFIIIGIIVVLLAVVLAVFMYRRFRQKRELQGLQTHELDDTSFNQESNQMRALEEGTSEERKNLLVPSGKCAHAEKENKIERVDGEETVIPIKPDKEDTGEQVRGKGGKFISEGKLRRIRALEVNKQQKKQGEIPPQPSHDDAGLVLSETSQSIDLPEYVPFEHDYCMSVPSNIEEEEIVIGCEDTGDDVTIKWNQGRRVIEIQHVIDKLIEGCEFCRQPLNFTNICGEIRYGLASMLQIKCVNCDMVVSVPTGKRHSRIDSDHPSRAFDVNTKLALGMLQAGIGQKKVSMLLSVLNIPSVCHKTLKKTEREVGKALEEVAKKSCDDMAAAEKESSSTPNELSVSFDGGWQKRGSGRSYSSLSGHAAMIGNETGKIVNFATRNSYCRVCDNSEKSGKDLSIHDCRKNWSKSAKAMEPDMCIQMLQELGQNDVNVSTVIMDNDSTTVARARLEVNPALKKQSDKNHTMKQFTNKLYNLKKSKNYKELNTKTINHISKCFKYCISQNQEDLSSLKKNLEAITPHVYGDHSLCDTWCGFLSSPETYKPQQLPYHRYLSNQQLKSDLLSLFGFYISQAEKLINLGSTQANESFNNTVASKTPKSTFYSGSESNDFRIASAVAQKNLGHQYVIQVNEKLLLSPGQVTSSSAKKTDLKRKRDKEREDTPAYKKNRAMKKMKKIDSQKSQESSEIREGTTYKTCVDLNNNEGDMENITEIPPPLRKPQSTPIVHDQCTFVYFDLETTGLGKDCEVTQIGAYASEKSFSQYILPSTQPISPSATAVLGIAVKENIMFKNGVQVPCKNAKDGIETFITWLKNFPNVVLVAHNAKFDSNVIIRAMHQVGLRASDFIIGFVDTLPLFREAVPNRKSYKQVDLMKDLCTAQYDAHDALADSEALQRLVLHLDISIAMMLKHSFSVDFVIENDKYAILLSRNASSLKHLVDENILSKFTANKIAASGLHYDHLCIAHHRDPVSGIKSILSEKNMGKVRVTSNGKIIKSLHQYFMKGN